VIWPYFSFDFAKTLNGKYLKSFKKPFCAVVEMGVFFRVVIYKLWNKVPETGKDIKDTRILK